MRLLLLCLGYIFISEDSGFWKLKCFGKLLFIRRLKWNVPASYLAFNGFLIHTREGDMTEHELLFFCVYYVYSLTSISIPKGWVLYMLNKSQLMISLYPSAEPTSRSWFQVSCWWWKGGQMFEQETLWFWFAFVILAIREECTSWYRVRVCYS